jgi:hypothetical protein
MDTPHPESQDRTGVEMTNAEYEIFVRAYDDLRHQIGYKRNYRIWNGFPYNPAHGFEVKDWFYTEYIDKPVNYTLAGSSIAMGFIGFDFIPESLGLIYSIARNDFGGMAGYGSALVIVGIGGEIAVGARQLRNITLPTNADEFVVISREGIPAIKSSSAIREALMNRIDDLVTFMNKTTAEKLDDIARLWDVKSPVNEMLDDRVFFEKLMGEYRYTKSGGWSHTGDIAPNFTGVDFYQGIIQGSDIIAETAVSMKTTTATNVRTWFNSTAIKNNVSHLRDGLSPDGITSNSRTMRITESAEIHIYMPKDNITPALRQEWVDFLTVNAPDIKFEIQSLETFVK